jgi:hypothetical protein
MQHHRRFINLHKSLGAQRSFEGKPRNPPIIAVLISKYGSLALNMKVDTKIEDPIHQLIP